MSLDDDSYLWRSPQGGDGPGGTQPSGIDEEDLSSFSIGGQHLAAPVERTHPASEGGARRRSANDDVAPAEPGALASKVLALRILEDDIAALLGEAESALAALEAERTLDDAGFRSAEEFRERVANQMGLLHSMREPRRRAPQATGRIRKRSHARGRGGDMRARRTQALTAIEQTMARFRELGGVIRGKVEEAHDLLAAIDRDRTYAECGYASFDEFLELAIGPSPILTKCLTALGELPRDPEPAFASPHESGSEDELPSLADPPGPIMSDDRPPALFEVPQDPPSEEPTSESASSDAPPPVDSARRSRIQRSALVVSVVLGIASAVIGTAAGVRASRAAEAAAATEAPPAPAPVVAPPAASHHAPSAAGPETKHGPVAQAAPASAPPLARRSHEDRPVLAPASPVTVGAPAAAAR